MHPPTNPRGGDYLVTTTEAAAMLGVSRFTVLRWIRSGELRARRIGSKYWLRASDVERFRDERDA